MPAVVEERALRDCLADRALDVAVAQIAAALELLIKPFENVTRLLARAARAFDRDMIASLLRDHAEATFDQCEVLSVLAEQYRRELVVFECKHGLGRSRLLGGGSGRDHGILGAQGGFRLLLL
jgi:NurA-like 5'-3' nuclease